jgi:hypothetical protein
MNHQLIITSSDDNHIINFQATEQTADGMVIHARDVRANLTKEELLSAIEAAITYIKEH